ncbi:MAG: glutamate synthase subunit beta [Clostridiales bacterium]|nr:glutamate synthase subunit beta [Clostridiales bacterium]
MGKPTGFLEYQRLSAQSEAPKQRIGHYNEFHLPLTAEARVQQAARCMECGVPFCHAGVTMHGVSSGCPLRNLIPEWNDLLYTGNLAEALARLLKTNNFPEFTSRVCPAPCEAACTCGKDGLPVTIKENEGAISAYGFDSGAMTPRIPAVRTGKRVAVIGSGPAGLAAADQLNQRGHTVTVYEREDRPGGLLMYGIPNMKLEKDVVLRRVRLMEEEGVEFLCNQDVGRDVDARKLAAQYDAVILACGASQPRDIQVPGREAEGIHFAVDFLKSTTKSLLDHNMREGTYLSAKDKHVLVIGGGDTGNDCVGTAVRHGAASVLQLEMRPKPPEERAADNPWPQWPNVHKTDYGQEEHIAVFGRDPRRFETTVKEFLTDENGRVSQARLVKLQWSRDAETGRHVMQELTGTETLVDADLVLIAAGFTGCEPYVAEAFQTRRNDRSGTIETNQYAAGGGLFAAGDARRGQSLVVWAIREGREAARAVDLHLMGYSNLE